VRGCTKISPGCLHCYAETFAERFRGVPGHAFESGFDLRLVPEKLDQRTYDEFPERRQNPVPDLESRRNALERLEAELV
jgi:hypothetical protein